MGLREELDRHVSLHAEEMLAKLGGYVDRGGVSLSGEGIAAAGEHLERLMRDVGLAVERWPGARHPFLVGRSAPDADKPTVLLYGHYDVQEPGPLAAWTTPPFESSVRDGRIYGRGTADNKGQHLAHLLAIGALRELRGELPCNVAVVVDGEEEIGSPGIAAAIAEHGPRLGADVAIWSDGARRQDDRDVVCLGVRGLLTFGLRRAEARAPVHSGNWDPLALDPTWELVQLLASLRDADGEVSIDGFDPAPPGTVRPGLAINALECDGGRRGARAVVPAQATALCDLRLAPGQRTAQAARLLRAHVARRSPATEVTVSGAMEASATPPDAPYVEAVRSAVARAGGEEPLLVEVLGGALPLFAFTEILGIPCVGVPLANRDGRAHAPDENLPLDRFFAGVVSSALILDAIGSA